jgi:hypothetical protein
MPRVGKKQIRTILQIVGGFLQKKPIRVVLAIQVWGFFVKCWINCDPIWGVLCKTLDQDY